MIVKRLGILAIAVFCSCWVKGVSAQTIGGQLISAPILPQVTPSVVFPPDAGYTHIAVASGANLQTAITGAACGTKLLLAANGSFTAGGTAYTLPNTACTCHTDSSQYVIIQSDDPFYLNGSVRGTQIDPSVEYTKLAHISNTDITYTLSALANGVSCYWLGPGLHLFNPPNNVNALIALNDGTQTSANFAHDIVIDHDFLEGFPTFGNSRGITLGGNFQSVIDSYLSDFHKVGSDAQAILIRDGFGPMLIQSNFLEGAAENTMVGGAPSMVQTANISFIGNHYFKPLAWWLLSPTYAGIHWSVKNLFELKNAKNVLVTRNVMENSWRDGQPEVFIMNPGCSGAAPGIDSVNDVTVFLNNFAHSPQAMIYGGCSDPITHNIQRVSSHDNLYWDIDPCAWGKGGDCSFGYQDTQFATVLTGPIFAPSDIWHVHDTIYSTNSHGALQFNGTSGLTPGNVYYGMQFRDSIIGSGSGGAFKGQGVAVGDPLITNFTPAANFKYDCMYGADAGSYANAAYAGRQNPASAAAVFVNPGVDFHVKSGSVCQAAASDGKDMGADIDALNAATAGVVQTLANLHTVTNISPTTFTSAGGTMLTVTGTNFISGEAQVIIGGSGPSATISTNSCAVNTCTVVTSTPITLAVADTVCISGGPNVGAGYVTTGCFVVASWADVNHFTYTDTGVGTVSNNGGIAFRSTNGALCTSPSVTPTQITCQTPAGTVGGVGVSVTQFGVPIQSPVFGAYN